MLATFLAFIACEEPIDKPIQSEQTNQIVVEGLITSENVSHLIRISHPYKIQQGIAEPVSGASVTIKENNNVYMLTEQPMGSGKYYTPAFRAITGKAYELLIQYQGKEYTARDSTAPVEPLPPIQYYPVNGTYSLDFQTFGNNPNYINHEISWHNTPACTGTPCSEKVVFYDLKTIDIHEIYKPKKEAFYFPLGATITRVKYSVSPAYKLFLRSMLSETQWRGGVFDVQRANVLTNLRDGAIGFFASCTVVSDTTVVK